MAISKSAGNKPIIQTAFVVPDIRAAIGMWAKDLGVGPWFLVESITGDDPEYRGQSTDATFTLATAFAGDMQIELIEMDDERPSVFREWVDKRGYGLHHLAIGSEDVEADVRKYQGKGYERVFSCGSPLGGRIAFMSAGVDKPAMVEIIPMTEAVVEFHKMSREACESWDGVDPIRALG